MLKILLQNEAGKNFVMYLKLTNLENQLHISESPTENFNNKPYIYIYSKNEAFRE